MHVGGKGHRRQSRSSTRRGRGARGRRGGGGNAGRRFREGRGVMRGVDREHANDRSFFVRSRALPQVVPGVNGRRRGRRTRRPPRARTLGRRVHGDSRGPKQPIVSKLTICPDPSIRPESAGSRRPPPLHPHRHPAPQRAPHPVPVRSGAAAFCPVHAFLPAPWTRGGPDRLDPYRPSNVAWRFSTKARIPSR